MRLAAFVALVVACTACNDAMPPAAVASAASPEEIAAEVAVARAGCVRCHGVDGESSQRLAPRPGPPLAAARGWRSADGGAVFLRSHHGGDDAADLAAWVIALGARQPAPAPAEVAPAAIARGERLARELACGACHAPQALGDLPARTSHGLLARFLAAPRERLPDLVHPPLSPPEADDVAAWLLRAQAGDEPPVRGFAWACFHQRIEESSLPELDGRQPDATGVAERIDATAGTRERHFVLRFEATLDVPAAGDWTFTTGSDDSSWLWLDGELVVTNAAIAPHRKKRGTVRLTAGAHALRVVYTQAAGERTLEALWRGPGVAEEPLPAARATAHRLRLTPPQPPATPPVAGSAAIARGRAAARAHRCDACHAIDDAAFTALPAPPPARAWNELRAAPCPRAPAGKGLREIVRGLASRLFDDRSALAHAMLRDGCLSCHARDGRGGLPPAVRAGLLEVEDLGDEGRLPPDLTAVGRRLRPAWLHDVLANGTPVRPYLRVRMPHLGAETAREYAALFAAVDAVPGETDDEPPFSLAAAEFGRTLAGAGGRNCITCHRFQGHRSLGSQGMDLAVQYARLRPAWFRDWLLHPSRLRSGTRMPTTWIDDDAAACAEVDAIRTWLSLGYAAPLPRGVGPAADSLQLVPAERPLLHGAFLRDVSARCLCVGTRERTHFAFDLAACRLVWLWRGDFVDAGGTWTGRAGKLLAPAGTDWLVLDDFTIAGGPTRRLLGQRRTADGYPVLRVGVGDAEYEDEARPRLVAGGSEVVRTLRCVRGSLELVFPPPPEGVTVSVGGRQSLAAGQSVEVVYRW